MTNMRTILFAMLIVSMGCSGAQAQADAAPHVVQEQTQATEHTTAQSVQEQTAEQAAPDIAAQIDAALMSADKQAVPGGFVIPQSDITEVAAPYTASFDGETLLYIDETYNLTVRKGGQEQKFPGIVAITHAQDGIAYVLEWKPEDAQQSADDQGEGWDGNIQAEEGSAPTTERTLSAPREWYKLDIAAQESTLIAQNIASVPIINGGFAYALDGATGGIMRIEIETGKNELIYIPPEGAQLRLYPAPQGIICARYDSGILIGCCAISADGALPVADWTAGAVFEDGLAISAANADDGTGRAGLYAISASGETQLDEYARADWLFADGKLYYWHADPEQAYGFSDLMAYDPATGAAEPLSGAEEVRGRLLKYGGKAYMTNYDSELYSLDVLTGELEYAMDLSVDSDFNSDLMPACTLFEQDGALHALLYVDEGEGYRFIGEAINDQ